MSRPLVTLALLVFAVASLLPLGVMLVRTTPGDLAQLFEPRILALLLRTVRFGLGSALVALSLGLPFGFLVARTDLPGAALLRTVGLVPLLLPPLMLAMTWTEVWPAFTGPPAAVIMLGFSTFPLVAIFAARAYERIDARIGEAALLAGGKRAVLRLELPLVLPAALTGACLSFAFAVHDFAVPDFLSWAGPKFNVYADEIYLNWNMAKESGDGMGLAMATALPLILITLLALLPALALRRRGAMASLGADFRSPAPLALGAWRLPALGFVLLVLIVTCGVPLGRLLWEAAGLSARPAEGEVAPTFAASLAAIPTQLSGAFRLALEQARGDIGRSLLYSASAALLCAPLGLVLGHAIERTRRRRLARFFEVACLLPIAAPAVGFSIGAIGLWNHDLTATFYDGGGMAFWMYVGRFAPFAVLISALAVSSLTPAMEDAATLVGVSPARRMVHIVGPLLKGTLIASFFLVFVFAMRDLDSAILVPAANKTAVCRLFNAMHFGRQSFIAALALLIVFAILLPGLLWSLFAKKRLEILP